MDQGKSNEDRTHDPCCGRCVAELQEHEGIHPDLQTHHMRRVERSAHGKDEDVFHGFEPSDEHAEEVDQHERLDPWHRNRTNFTPPTCTV